MRAGSPEENTIALSALDDYLKWGAPVYSVYGGGQPKLEETEMIYIVIVNKCRR